FEDYLSQMDNLKKMGNINDIISMIPGLAAKMQNIQIDEKILVKNKAIIQSMTIKERRNPDLIKASQKKRIATGSGTTIQDVNTLLKQFEQSKEMLKQFKNKKGLGKLFGLL
ncbi:MAG: signal recognition particle protein, partial [Clostridia bacterium]|nr:signal recognition particle protein [Clostridia bacterium]